MVNDEGINSWFHEYLGEFYAKVPAQANMFCGIYGSFFSRFYFGGDRGVGVLVEVFSSGSKVGKGKSKRLILGLWDGDHPLRPIDGGVCGF